jgi:hypothetical protein
MKEYVEAQQQVDEHMNAHYSYVPRAPSGLMAFVLRQVHGGPPGANKPHQAAAQVARKYGYKFKHSLSKL